MTRINSGISPDELCDQHLVAEYREIGRIGVLLQKRANRPNILAGAPVRFTLGAGHMLFFIDKGLYLERRFSTLCNEMNRRGYRTNLQWRNHWEGFPHLYNDWVPTSNDRQLILDRLKIRMPKKPRMTNPK